MEEKSAALERQTEPWLARPQLSSSNQGIPGHLVRLRLRGSQQDKPLLASDGFRTDLTPVLSRSRWGWYVRDRHQQYVKSIWGT